MKLAAIVLLLAPMGCVQTYDIAAYKTPCWGEGPLLCMIVDKGDGEGEGAHYSGIRRFDFVWGVEVVARVRESPVLNPPADGSSIRYGLVRIVEETKVEAGIEFVWSLDSGHVQPDWGIPWIDLEAGTLLDGTPFACANAEACAAVQTSADDGIAIRVTFAFDEFGGVEVVDAELE